MNERKRERILAAIKAMEAAHSDEGFHSACSADYDEPCSSYKRAERTAARATARLVRLLGLKQA